MKRICVFTVFTLLLAAMSITMTYGGSKQGVEKVTLKIEGMVTPCCVPEIEETLLKVKGVKKVFVCIKRGNGKERRSGSTREQI